MYGSQWVCPSSRQLVFPGYTLLRLQRALQGHCPKRALHFVHYTGLSHSCSRVLHKGTDSVGHAFRALPGLSTTTQHKRRHYTWTSPDGRHQNQIDCILCSQTWRHSIHSAKARLGTECDSDHEILIAKFRLKLKKWRKPLDHSDMT